MVYASYTSGYKGPAFDTTLISAGSSVKPETSDAWETGLKSRLFDNRLFLNIAVFYAEYKDFQAETSIDDTPNDLRPGSPVLINAGEVSTQGVEIEFLAQPMVDWSIAGGVAYTDGMILRERYVVDANKTPPHNVSIKITGIVQLSNITNDVVSNTP